MGYYADGILLRSAPSASAFAPGRASGIAAKWTGAKIPRSLFWTVIVFQCFVYFCAQYIIFERMHLVYRDSGLPVGFSEYFDIEARSITFRSMDHSDSSQPDSGTAMGVWGYGFKFLELAGFAFAGVVIPAAIRKIPYCENCRRYMEKKGTTFLGASVKPRKIKKTDTEGRAAFAEEDRAAREVGGKCLEGDGRDGYGSRQVDALLAAMAALKPKKMANFKLPLRYQLTLHLCPTCRAGQLVALAVTGKGKGIKYGPPTAFPIASDHPSG